GSTRHDGCDRADRSLIDFGSPSMSVSAALASTPSLEPVEAPSFEALAETHRHGCGLAMMSR
ncbi:hypothetical protein U5801_29665, partial [Lamprobacter modestohalophilus]|uniref:hypothetical protein n=1 Tax=Lamprobacter modestohalophilus TaxID=1064514 RepID=UPI002ADEB6F8